MLSHTGERMSRMKTTRSTYHRTRGELRSGLFRWTLIDMDLTFREEAGSSYHSLHEHRHELVEQDKGDDAGRESLPGSTIHSRPHWDSHRVHKNRRWDAVWPPTWASLVNGRCVCVRVRVCRWTWLNEVNERAGVDERGEIREEEVSRTVVSDPRPKWRRREIEKKRLEIRTESKREDEKVMDSTRFFEEWTVNHTMYMHRSILPFSLSLSFYSHPKRLVAFFSLFLALAFSFSIMTTQKRNYTILKCVTGNLRFSFSQLLFLSRGASSAWKQMSHEIAEGVLPFVFSSA